MSIHIDRTNYEAFYLDYLEGNLSGEPLQAFQAFLSAHPELVMEDELPPALEPAEETMDATIKLAMKAAVDMNELSAETISYFLIAHEEGLLTTDQQAQLENWLSANAHYRTDARLFAMTKLVADQADIFTGKAGMKHKPARIIPLWFSGAAVAAGLALIITLSMNPGDDSPDQPIWNTPVAVNKKELPGTALPRVTPANTALNSNTTTDVVNRTLHSTPAARHFTEINPASAVASVEELQKRPLNMGTSDRLEVIPLEIQPLAAHTVESPGLLPEDLSWVKVDQMRNPIEPITSKLSATLNTPIDFRTAKASKKKGNGFFLKIGKLEISRNSASL